MRAFPSILTPASVLASAMGHLLVLGLLSVTPTPTAAERSAHFVDFMTPHVALEIEPDPDPDYESPEEAPAERVVDAPETGEEGSAKVPPRFAAARSTFTEQETQARLRIVSEDRVASSDPSAPGSSDQGDPTPPTGAASPSSGSLASVNLARMESDTPTGSARHDMSPGVLSIQIGGSGAGRPPGFEGEGRVPTPAPLLPGPLSPTLGDLRQAIRGTGLEDLEDIEEGDRTLLNAVEWRHAPFFNRIQRQVEQFWRPAEEFIQHDPTGHIYGFRDRHTVLKVVLNENGTLRAAYVIEESGAGFLDEEAIQAVESAAPFSRPPRSLVDPESNIVAFRFSFTVQVNEAPLLQIQRERP